MRKKADTMLYTMNFHGETDELGIERDPDLFAASVTHPEPVLPALGRKVREVVSRLVFSRSTDDSRAAAPQERDIL